MDFGGVRSRSARVRAKSTPGGSARGPPEVRADPSGSAAGPRRTEVRPFNSLLLDTLFVYMTAAYKLKRALDRVTVKRGVVYNGGQAK